MVCSFTHIWIKWHEIWHCKALFDGETVQMDLNQMWILRSCYWRTFHLWSCTIGIIRVNIKKITFYDIQLTSHSNERRMAFKSKKMVIFSCSIWTEPCIKNDEVWYSNKFCNEWWPKYSQLQIVWISLSCWKKSGLMNNSDIWNLPPWPTCCY